MKIIKFEETKTNSALLLVLTGILLVPCTNYIDNILSYSALMLSSLFNEPSYVIFIITSFVFKATIIISIVYIIIKVLKKDVQENIESLIVLREKHIKVYFVLVIMLFTISILLNHLGEEMYMKALSKYMEHAIGYKSFIFNLLEDTLSILKDISLALLFFFVLRSSK